MYTSVLIPREQSLSWMYVAMGEVLRGMNTCIAVKSLGLDLFQWRHETDHKIEQAKTCLCQLSEIGKELARTAESRMNTV